MLSHLAQTGASATEVGLIRVEMADDEGLSIEETNKLRISLGLKPLNVSSSSVGTKETSETADSSENQERIAAENFRQRQATEQKDLASKATAERISKARDRAERSRKIAGITLGDDDGEEDTLAWITRTRQLGPRTVIKQESPKSVVPSYTSTDLAGLKVAHDVTDFEEGNDIVLTLKDGGVLDEEVGDELISLDMREKEELEHKLKTKKRKSVYTGYSDDEVDPNTGEKRILARYDEDVDAGARKKEGFSIGSATLPKVVSGSGAVKRNRVAVSLESSIPSAVLKSDYSSPVKMKKPKKQKVLRRHKDNEMSEPLSASVPEVLNVDDKSFVDDDDLQASIARQRRIAAQKRAAFAKSLLISTPEESNLTPETAGLVFDEASEYTRILAGIKAPEAKTIKREKSSPVIAELEKTDVAMKDNDGQETHAKSDSSRQTSSAIIFDEATFDKGVGSAVAALKQKGQLQENEEEAKLQRQNEVWLANDRRVRLEVEQERNRYREELRSSAKYQKMSVREREAFVASENRRLDAREAKINQDRFKNYKPNIDLKYTDDFGRNMNEKEAFKYMSHKFHGKGSGSGKTAKKLAQIEKEKADEQKSLFSR